jgi:siroheme synthase-like protein
MCFHLAIASVADTPFEKRSKPPQKRNPQTAKEKPFAASFLHSSWSLILRVLRVFRGSSAWSAAQRGFPWCLLPGASLKSIMAETRPYPIFLNLAGRDVLIVGGGAVAQRKLASLLESGAKVTIVSPRFSGDLGARRDFRRIRTRYAARHMKLKPWRLVFAATDSRAVNALVQKHAADARIPCCRSDSWTGELASSDFSNGATANVQGIVLAVSTTGSSPALARRMRDQAHTAIDPILVQLAGLFQSWRPAIKSRLSDPARRRLLLLRLAGEDMEAALRKSGPAAARKLFARWLKEARSAAADPLKITRGPRRPPPRISRHAH